MSLWAIYRAGPISLRQLGANMGVDPLTVGLTLGGAALSAVQASESNSAARRAAEQQKAANKIASNREKESLARDFAQLEGSLRATAAGRGVAGSASALALSQSAGYAGTANQGAINTNLRLANIQADQRAAAAYQNPFFAGLQGGLQGYMLGSSLSSLGFGASGAGALGTKGGFAGLSGLETGGGLDQLGIVIA